MTDTPRQDTDNETTDANVRLRFEERTEYEVTPPDTAETSPDTDDTE